MSVKFCAKVSIFLISYYFCQSFFCNINLTQKNKHICNLKFRKQIFMKLKYIILTISLFTVGMQVKADTTKKKKKKPSTNATAPVAASNGIKSIETATKNCKKYAGYISVYQDSTNGSAYLEIDSSMLNQNIVYFTYSENGLVNAGLFKGSYRETSVIKFERLFDKINVIKVNTGFYFNPENPISKSANSNITNALVSSEKIIGAGKKGKLLISADNLLSSEILHQLAANIPPGFQYPFRLGRINPAKTYAKAIRSYPENTDLVYTYTFDNSPGSFASDGTSADARYVTVEVQHSFIKMPDDQFKPRYDDPRVGYFTHQVNDMTTTSSTNYKDLVHRWRLEKKDPKALISEPVKPITWWIENTTPLEFRETIMKAALTWNLAFEPLGFKNAVEVKIQPDTATWDAGDIRYNVLRWTSSPNPPFGGYGPSFVNPLTGEILGADIMLEWIFVTNRVVAGEVYNPQPHSMENDQHFCSAGHHLQMEKLFGMEVLAAKGASKIAMDDLVQQSLFYLILHEMGHTFGLNHNMRASQLHLPSDINNVALTSRVGLTGSVMDYPAINFAPLNKQQGQYVTTRPGPYDLWAIDFGYSVALTDEAAEQARLQKLLSKSTESQLAFGNDADDMRSPGKGIDPRVMIGDMSGDAIAYAKERMELCQSLINQSLNNYTDSNQSYHDFKKKVMILAGEYNIQAGVVSRYIGGVYVDRAFVGQANAGTPYTPVPLKDQKRAMDLLVKNVFCPEPILFSDTITAHLQTQRRGFGFFASGEDPKMHSIILNMQSNVLDHVLSSSVLTRLVDSKLYGNEYDITQLFTDLTNGIFKEDAMKTVNSYRQNLQIEYVKRLMNIAGLPEGKAAMADRYNNIANARAFAALESIKKMMDAGKSTGDEGSKQHKAYISAMIANAMK